MASSRCAAARVRAPAFWKACAAALCAAAAVDAAAAAPDFLFVVIDLAGAPAKTITGAPERCPTLHGLARNGVTLINVAASPREPFETIGELLGDGTSGVLRAASAKYSAARVWVCAESAGRLADVGRGVNFFAPDVRHAAFRPAIERYGLAPPLGVEEMAVLAKLRARYGPELTAGESALAELFAVEEYPFDPEAAVFRRVTQLIEEREALCIVALVPGARIAGRTLPGEDAIRIDRHVGEIWTLLSVEPYRNRAACVYISLACGAGDPTRVTSALLVGPGFQTGMVVQAPVTTSTLSAVLLRVLGQPSAAGAPALPDGILAP